MFSIIEFYIQFTKTTSYFWSSIYRDTLYHSIFNLQKVKTVIMSPYENIMSYEQSARFPKQQLNAAT